MRIALITSLFPPHARGGAERVVEEEAEGLSAMGHDVHVITTGTWAECGAGVMHSRQGNANVWRFYPPNLFFYNDIGRFTAARRSLWHAVDTFNAASAHRVQRLLREIRPDVIHTHNIKGLGFLVPSAVRRARLPHVHTTHDVQLVEPSGLLMVDTPERTNVRMAYAAVTRRLFGSPEIVIAPSDFLRGFYARWNLFPRSITVVLSNPGGSNLAQPRPERANARFLFLGQLERHKGIHLLLAAFSRFRSVEPPELWIAGSGSLQPEVEMAAQADTRIRYLGRVAPAQIPSLMADVSFTVTPSICFENTPTVITESFLNGVPALASDAPGAAEHVCDGHNGLVFASNDENALLAALHRALEQPYSQLSNAATAFVAPQLRHVHCDQLGELYRRAIELRGVTKASAAPGVDSVPQSDR